VQKYPKISDLTGKSSVTGIIGDDTDMLKYCTALPFLYSPSYVKYKPFVWKVTINLLELWLLSTGCSVREIFSVRSFV